MNTQINITESGTTTLATAGKYCDRNIDVNVNVPDSYYDTFWDKFQEQGKREKYHYAFGGHGWTDETFKPKYNIVCNKSSERMFSYSRLVDLKACLESCGVTLDLSKSTTTSYLCHSCGTLTTLPKIDLSSATTNSQTFYADYSLKTIDELVVSEKTPFASSFYDCNVLENMIVTGTIGKNGFNVQWSTNLTHDSLMSIINALADKSGDTSGTTWKVTIGAENYAKLTADEIAIAEMKGWELA